MKKAGKTKEKKTESAKSRIKQSFSTGATRAGSYSSAVMAIAVASGILVTLIFSRLPSSFTKKDLSALRLSCVCEDESLRLLEGLEDDISVYHIVTSGREDEYITNLLEDYAEKSNGHITVTKKDPSLSNFASAYTDTEIEDNSVIFELGDRYRYISYSELYQKEYLDELNSSYNVYFYGESYFTGAIDFLTNRTLPKVYNITGHSEAALEKSFSAALGQENFTLASLKLAENDIPSDADCLILLSPGKDFTEQESEKLLKYLDGGGRLYVTTDYDKNIMLPKLLGVLASYGLSRVEGGILLEGDASGYASVEGQGYPQYLMPRYGSHDIVLPLAGASASVLFPFAQGLTLTETQRESISAEALLMTTQDAYLKLNPYDSEDTPAEFADGDVEGEYTLGYAVTQTRSYSNATKIVFFGTSKFMSESIDYMVSGSNTDLFLNSMSWLCDKTSSVGIHAKLISYESLSVAAMNSNIINVIFICIIPLALVAAGIGIAVIRKRR